MSARAWIFGALAIAVLLCVGSGCAIVHRRIASDRGDDRERCERLAGRDMAVEIPGVGRKDEIGAMAEAVEVFKDNMIDGRSARRRTCRRGCGQVIGARRLDRL